MSFRDRDTVIYLACFTDAEGSICILKHKRKERLTPAYEPRLQVGNTNEEVVDLFVDTFGGSKTPLKKLTAGGKRFYHCELHGVPMVKALEAMLPHLRIKREEAKLVIALQKRIWKRSEREGDSKGVSSEELEAREKLYQQIKRLTGKTRQLHFDIKDSPPRLL